LELALSVGALRRDFPVTQSQDVAALDLVAGSAARGASRQPLDHGQLGAREVPDLVPPNVGNAPEHVLEELANRRLSDDAHPPRVLAEGRLEDHVVGHHVEDSVEVVPVPHRVESRDERFAIERHAAPPS